MTEEALDGMLHLPEVVHRHIQLSTNAAENQMLRSEFYYEQVGFQLICLIHSVGSDVVGVLTHRSSEVECAFECRNH